MATIKRFEDLEIWQMARVLANKIFALTEKEKFSRDYKLRDQIRGSCGSAMDNIAEGFGRGGNKEFSNFLSITIGSCSEVQSQLYRALDWQYILGADFKECYDLADSIKSKSGKLIIYLASSEYKGKKYRVREKQPDEQ